MPPDVLPGGDQPTLGEVIRNQNRLEQSMGELSRDVRTMLGTAQKVEDVERRVTIIEKALDRAAVTSGATVRQVVFIMLGGVMTIITGIVLGLAFGSK